MDQKLLFFINRQWTHPALDRFMAAVSSFDVWLWPMAVLAILVWKKGRFRARGFIIVAALVVGINDGVVARSLKRITNRPRPHELSSDVRQVDLARATPRFLAIFNPAKVKFAEPPLGNVNGRSFPSGHTINSFSIALVCTAFYRRRGWLAFLPAALVAYSRIYTGAHWPTDILASIFIALGFTLLLLALFELLWHEFGPRFFPRWHAARPTLLAA